MDIKLLNESKVLKRAFLSTTSMATELHKQITTASEWSWAKNVDNLGKLEETHNSLKGRVQPFHSVILTEDWATMRKNNKPEFLTIQMTSFCKLKESVDELQNICDLLVRRHRA